MKTPWNIEEIVDCREKAFWERRFRQWKKAAHQDGDAVLVDERERGIVVDYLDGTLLMKPLFLVKQRDTVRPYEAERLIRDTRLSSSTKSA